MAVAVVAALSLLVLLAAVMLGRPTAAVLVELRSELDRVGVPDDWRTLGDVSEVLARDVLTDEVVVRRAWAAPRELRAACDELAAAVGDWGAVDVIVEAAGPGPPRCRGGGVVARSGPRLWVRGNLTVLTAVDADPDAAFGGRDQRGPLGTGEVLVTVQARTVRPSLLH